MSIRVLILEPTSLNDPDRFLVEEKGMPKGYKVGEEHPAPSLQELKQLFRWYIASTKGKLDPQGRPTMKTTLI